MIIRRYKVSDLNLHKASDEINMSFQSKITQAQEDLNLVTVSSGNSKFCIAVAKLKQSELLTALFELFELNNSLLPIPIDDRYEGVLSAYIDFLEGKAKADDNVTHLYERLVFSNYLVDSDYFNYLMVLVKRYWYALWPTIVEGDNKATNYEIYLSTPWPYLPEDLLVDPCFIKQWVERNITEPQTTNLGDQPRNFDRNLYYWQPKQKRWQLRCEVTTSYCGDEVYFYKRHFPVTDTNRAECRREGHLNICIESGEPSVEVHVWFHDNSYLLAKEEVYFEGRYVGCYPSDDYEHNRIFKLIIDYMDGETIAGINVNGHKVEQDVTETDLGIPRGP